MKHAGLHCGVCLVSVEPCLSQRWGTSDIRQTHSKQKLVQRIILSSKCLNTKQDSLFSPLIDFTKGSCSVSSYKNLSSTSRCSSGLKLWAGWPAGWWTGLSRWWWQPRPTPASSWTCRSGVCWGPSAPCAPAGGPEGGTGPDWHSPCPESGPSTPSGGSADQRCVYRGSGPYHSDLEGSWSLQSRLMKLKTAVSNFYDMIWYNKDVC